VPVTLPSGRERLFARPSATGSPAVVAITMGIVRVASNAASVALPVSVTITLTGMRANSAASAGSAYVPFRQTEIEHDRLSLDITEGTKSFAKGSQGSCGLTGSGRQNTDPRRLGRLLRARRERPNHRHAKGGYQFSAGLSLASAASIRVLPSKRNDTTPRVCGLHAWGGGCLGILVSPTPAMGLGHVKTLQENRRLSDVNDREAPRSLGCLSHRREATLS
jgi:hypothetical protein